MSRGLGEIVGREIALGESERTIGEGEARGEVEQREREGEAARRWSRRGRESGGQRDGDEEDGRGRYRENGELLADDACREPGRQACRELRMLAPGFPGGCEGEGT